MRLYSSKLRDVEGIFACNEESLPNYPFPQNVVRGGRGMPYYVFKEVWTPLKYFGIRFYREEKAGLFVKIWNQPRRKLGIRILKNR